MVFVVEASLKIFKMINIQHTHTKHLIIYIIIIIIFINYNETNILNV